MKHLKVPLDRAAVESLKLGEVIELSGTVHTLRDEAHKEALEIHHRSEPLPFDLANGVVFHCGPIMKRKGDEWELVAAEPPVGVMRREGCVYLSTTGGAAVLAARGISAVHGVHWLGLGMPEAVWVFEMNHFGPLIVSIDAHGNSLYDRVDADVRESLTNIKKRIGI